MAPIYVDLQVWEAANLPWLTVLSVVILFILCITLIALCTSCQRQSFTLEDSSVAEKGNSTLVRVVKSGESGKTPRRTIVIPPEDLQLGPNEQFKQWRSHTLVHEPQTTVNGAIGNQ